MSSFTSSDREILGEWMPMPQHQQAILKNWNFNEGEIPKQKRMNPWRE